MKNTVVVSTARKPYGVAFKGPLSNIKSPAMTAPAIRHVFERIGVEAHEVDVRGMAVASSKPEEMGFGLICAVPKLFEQRDFGTDYVKFNIQSGSIEIGYPYGMSAADLFEVA
jgi:hypothetical protein